LDIYSKQLIDNVVEAHIQITFKGTISATHKAEIALYDDTNDVERVRYNSSDFDGNYWFGRSGDILSSLVGDAQYKVRLYNNFAQPIAGSQVSCYFALLEIWL